MMHKTSPKSSPLPAAPDPPEGAPRSKSEARAEHTAERLLDAAAQFFMEKGYETTSMGEIAKFAHASKETFYRHFPTKEVLFRAVVLRRAREMAITFGAILSVDDPPAKALTAFGELVLERIVTAQANGFHRVMSMERERFPDFAEMFHKQGPAKIHASLSEYLEAQIARGLLRPMNTMTAARQFFDLVAAEIIIGATRYVRGPITKEEIRSRVAEAVDCFLNGYVGRPTI